MKLTEFKNELRKHPGANLRFMLPNQEVIPAHAHVTEVARIDKRFIDCGGTLRNDANCRLQTWFSDDLDHRLTAGKLVKILDLAAPILGTSDLDVDVEHEVGFISQFPIGSVEISEKEILIRLTERHTECLAPEKCKPAARPVSESNPLKFNFRDQNCRSKETAE
jgi:Family of unknown function (DUF6428)